MTNALYNHPVPSAQPRQGNALWSRAADWAIRNGLELANAYQVPRDLGATLVNALMQAPGSIAGATQAHLTGEIPLPTGEPGRAFTRDDAYRGGALATNALGSAGLMAGPIAGRALQGVAATNKPAASIRAYHGTASPTDFDEFKVQPGGEIGPFFGPAHVANEYTKTHARHVSGEKRPRVMPVDINARKMLDVVGDRNRYISADELRQALEQAGSPTGHISRKLSEKVQLRELRDWAKLEGFDVVRRRHHRPDPASPTLDEQPHAEYMPLKRGTVQSATTGKTLFSDNRGAAPAGITAYHGSPHEFDRFSMDKIGTGEGAQAYGHGLYFAENPSVATSYRRNLAGAGKSQTVPQQFAQEMLQMADGDYGRAVEIAKAQIDSLPAAETNGIANLTEAMKLLESRSVRQPGRLYEVNIKASKDDFLDFDTPFEKQPTAVQEAIRKVAGRSLDDDDYFDLPVQDLLQTIAARTAPRNLTPQQRLAGPHISKMLREAGIPGIKYLDQGSRGSGQGTYNYVVFDENLIEIANKMGIAVPFPGVPGAVSIPGDQMERLQAAQQVIDNDTWDIY